jgi:hypothetical protein
MTHEQKLHQAKIAIQQQHQKLKFARAKYEMVVNTAKAGYKSAVVGFDTFLDNLVKEFNK